MQRVGKGLHRVLTGSLILWMSLLPGTVVHSEFLGSTLRYGVRVGAAEVSIDTPFHSGEALYQPGSAVEIGLSLRSALWLAA